MFASTARGIPSFGDLAYHAPVNVATDTVALSANTLAPAAGISFGQTLTANANGSINAEVTMVGNIVAVGDRLLVRSEGSPKNGIYTVTVVGDATHPWKLTRATDADSAVELPTGSLAIALTWPGGDITLFVQTAAGAWVTVPQGMDAIIVQGALGSSIFGAGVSISGGLLVGGSIAGIGDLTLSGTGVPTINGGGTATFGTRTCAWLQLGPLVVFRLSFTVTANGSGATALTVTTTGFPSTAASFRATGDRGGVGVTPIFARCQNTTGMTFTSIVTVAAPATSLTGVDLVNGAAYAFAGAYLNA